jgi:hypothetical protein
MNCEIEIAMNATQTETYPCNRPSSVICYESGTKICDLHTEECRLCHEFVCTECAYMHGMEPHAKPKLTVSAVRIKHSA